MTELDEELGPLALETIDEFGKSITINFAGVDAEYDPDTGKTIPGDGGGPKLVKAIPEGSNAKGLVEGALERYLIAAAAVDRKPGGAETVTSDGTTLAVLQVDTTYSGDLPCLYALHVGHK